MENICQTQEKTYGNPTTQIKVTNPDGTTNNYTITNNEDIKKIPIPPGSTVEITTELKPGEGIEEVKVLVKDEKTNQKVETIKNKQEEQKWITVEKRKYVYNNGGTGYWEKCLINDIEVDETGIIEQEETKRIKTTYQVSEDGKTWSNTFTNIQEAENKRYIRVIVEYQVISGNEYGDTSNNKIEIILNDGSWKITFEDEDGTPLMAKRVYFENSKKQGTITIPDLNKTKGEKQFICWTLNNSEYVPGKTYTITENITLTAYYYKTDIYTAEELSQFRDTVNSGKTFTGKTINLKNDIDLSNICGQTIGSWVPIGNYSANNTLIFSGTFEGNNHTINNLYINTTSNYQGLFGYSKDSKIANLNITGEVKGASYTGGLVGSQEGEIENCTNYVNINGVGNTVGGLAGYQNGTITRCKNKGTIQNTGYLTGGIVGNQTGRILQCANYANVTSNNYGTGGIAGAAANNTTSECFNKGNITSYWGNYTQSGGILGAAYKPILVSYCYNRGNIYGKNMEIGGISGACYNVRFFSLKLL